MIDKIDRMILNHICSDANISNVKLAKKIGVNTATVARRIHAMLDRKMITIKAVPELIKLGYRVMACIALKVDLTKIDLLREKLIEAFNVHLATATFGRYDLLLLASFQNWESLKIFLSEEISYMPGVKEINIFLISEVKKLGRDLFPNRSLDTPSIMLDDIDNKLLQDLCKDGQASYTDIANKLGVTPATVSRRVGALLKKEVMKIVAIPDPSKFGFSANAFIMLATDHIKANRICRQLDIFPQIQVTMTLTVGFDILAGVQFPNPELLYKFIKKHISGISDISSIETLIVAEYIKATYEWIDFDSIPLP